MFYKVGFLKTFTGKHLYWCLFSNKVAGYVCNFNKKETRVQVFSCKFSEILKEQVF